MLRPQKSVPRNLVAGFESSHYCSTMADGSKSVTLVDGSLDFSGGVNSIKTTTIQSPQNPGGLARNELFWLTNATVRDGGITQRTGVVILGTIHDSNALYQGGFLYEPVGANPYLIVAISGRIYKVFPDLASAPVDLSKQFNLTMPPTQPQFFFAQAEQFLIIQAGDGKTLPLFWDDTLLRRSKGITNLAVAPGTPGVNEIPAATAMDYYMGRLWYAQGRNYSAGDIVGGASGTLPYRFKDSVLNVTENPLVVGGDGFTVPTVAGNIRAIKHSANLDTSLDQGRLYIGTRNSIYSLQVPVTRTDWINANNNTQPLQSIVQIANGPVSDRSMVNNNGDLFYQSLEPGIRSLILATRFFAQWGNTPISSNEQRVLQFNDRSLLHMSSACVFDNRLLNTALPVQRPQGVIHQGLIPLDFIPISNFSEQKRPNWEGMYEGLDVLQLFSGDFGGLERCFSVVVSRIDSSIQLYELTNFQRDDFNPNGESRVTWITEFPAYTWGQEFLLKRLVSAELWVDKVFGEVIFTMEYRPDGDTCWHPWHQWKLCVAKSSCEDVVNPVCYPLTQYREGFKQTMTLPRPQTKCQTTSGRPVNVGYQFQPRLTIKGWCRIRGLVLKCEPVEQALYHDKVC